MDLILHFGAHRTGSTALIRCMEKNRDRLAAAGVAFRSPETLRAVPDFAPVAELTRRAAQGDAVAGDRLGLLRDRLAADAAEAGRQGATRLILSDENMIGTMPASLKHRTIYPDAAARLAAYATVLPARPALIAFAVRGYAGWWPSAYAYVLPRHPLPPFGALGDALAQGGRGWADVVRDLRAVFPGVPILLWPQETFADGMTRVVAALAGLAGTDGLEPVTARINPAHLRRQVEQIHRLRKEDPTLAGKALAARLAMLGEVKGRPPSFRRPQKAALEERYAADLEGLRVVAGRHANLTLRRGGRAAQAACHARLRISSRRSGIRSMARISSRTSQGNGLRRATVPSLSISTIMKPRGRSLVRIAEAAAGSVSAMTTTSRSASSGQRPSIRRICSMKGRIVGAVRKDDERALFPAQAAKIGVSCQRDRKSRRCGHRRHAFPGRSRGCDQGGKQQRTSSRACSHPPSGDIGRARGRDKPCALRDEGRTRWAGRMTTGGRLRHRS